MLSREELWQEQEELSQKLVLQNRFSRIKKIAGADQAFLGEKVISCLVVLSYPDLEMIEKKLAVKKVKFPYLPGLLAYRELSAILKVYQKLKNRPDLILVDGHGIAHPRNFGLASHLGVSLKIPTIGVAKKKLVGKYEKPHQEGEAKKLTYQGKQVGYALKSKKSCREIFISPGNFISLPTSLQVVKNCLQNHKLPEPLRLAHRWVNEYKRSL